MQNQKKKGFTLVEIMIVVVIIGLLAAMAIPAFNTVRTKAVEKTVTNDGRLIGASLQQALMETGAATAALSFSGDIYTVIATSTSGDVTTYTGTLSQGVSISGGTGTAGIFATDTDGAFTLSHAQLDSDVGFEVDGSER